MCELLISHGANVNSKTQSSQATPLHRAAYMGRTEVVTLLLHHGANVDQMDCDGMTPLHKVTYTDIAKFVAYIGVFVKMRV